MTVSTVLPQQVRHYGRDSSSGPTIAPRPDWPILTSYTGRHLDRVALPLGGIGTGTVSLGGRGDLRDWEIVNRPAKGFAPSQTFFALRAQAAGEPAVTRALEGVLNPPFEDARGAPAPNHGLPRFRQCSFQAAYPFGQVLLSDPDLPVSARIEAFNPLVPADPDRSGIPVAVLRFRLENATDSPVTVAICGNVQNFIGFDGTNGAADGNVNAVVTADGLAGVLLRSEGVDPASEQWGTIALATTASASASYRTAWANFNWGDSLLDFWDDFSADGRVEDRDGGGVDAPMASLCTRIDLAPRASGAITFLLTWHFPNRRAWGLSDGGGVNSYSDEVVGNYYATCYADAWDVARRTARDLPALEADSLRFVQAFCASDLPSVVKEAALYNLSTLRTQTCFRTADGHFYGWEGCNDTTGSCLGSCTHVWNYEQATAFLFGTLSRSMREVEFRHMTRDDGHMSFRVLLPLKYAREWGLAAADGQTGCIMKLYRDWQLSGDDELLRDLWPSARRALEFCWVPGGWDADRDGVMEGCQHNTMDVEYFGPNPQMGFWYLGALRAAGEMAGYLGEDDFASDCRDLFTRGSHWLDEHLFNGEYYEHEIRLPGGEDAIAPGLRHDYMGARDLRDPSLQLGAGCLVDQLVGQYMACVTGLGYLAEPDHIRRTLGSITRYNFREDLFGHFNHMRSYALNDESALLMCSYPRGRRPARPFPYYNEVMTGFEYTTAVHLLYEGERDTGLKVIAAIRDRYDGAKRSPFNEAECGHHYARAMASWAAVLALTGFHYSGVEQRMRFTAADGPIEAFWSTGYAWGTCRQEATQQGHRLELRVLGGSLKLRRLELAGAGVADLDEPRILSDSDEDGFRVLIPRAVDGNHREEVERD